MGVLLTQNSSNTDGSVLETAALGTQIQFLSFGMFFPYGTEAHQSFAFLEVTGTLPAHKASLCVESLCVEFFLLIWESSMEVQWWYSQKSLPETESCSFSQNSFRTVMESNGVDGIFHTGM